MTRTKVKGTRFKAAASPDEEPDFWHMAPVNPITPSHSSDEASTHSESMESQPEAFSVPSFSPLKARHDIPTSFTTTTFQEAPRPDVPMSQPPQDMEPIPFSPTDSSVEPIPFCPNNVSSDSDSEVLDEVVDELFLHESAEENDDILDFVNTWNPEAFEEQKIEDDIQLGIMLERILAE